MDHPFSDTPPGQDRCIIQHLALLTSSILILSLLLNIIAIGLGANPNVTGWRMGFMQQLGERCIVLLFGVALLSYSQQTRSIQRTIITFISCALGLSLSVSSFMYLQESAKFQSLALNNLTIQQQNLKQQIQQFTPQDAGQTAPPILPAAKTLAIDRLETSTQTLADRARIGLRKTVIRTFSSLFLVGLGLIIITPTTLCLQWSYKRG